MSHYIGGRRSLFIVKPDVIDVDGLLTSLSYDFEIINLARVQFTDWRGQHIGKSFYLIREHYLEHLGKNFYDRLIEFMTSGPITVGVIKGEWAALREWVMDYRLQHAGLGPRNCMHASDSWKSALREISVWSSLFRSKD